jgi:hypothetical protein
MHRALELDPNHAETAAQITALREEIGGDGERGPGDRP